MIIVFGVLVGQSQDKKAQEVAAQQTKEKAEKTAQLKQDKVDHFTANKNQIILSANSALADKKYQSVISQTNKYLVSGDEDLKKINYSAKSEKLKKLSSCWLS